LELLFMKLFLKVNLMLTLIQIKFQFSFGEFVCLFVCLFGLFGLFGLFVSILFLFHFSFEKLIFSFHLNTETKGWHQQFLQIVLRNLLNWCKCVGRSNLNNVLYPCILFFVSSFRLTDVNFIIWSVSSLIEISIGFWSDLSIFGKIISKEMTTSKLLLKSILHEHQSLAINNWLILMSLSILDYQKHSDFLYFLLREYCRTNLV
jgi:hypothetical protein